MKAAQPIPAEAHWLDTGCDVMTARDYDLAGQVSGHACILRFSAAGEHLRSRIGMTPTYSRENRVGLSTFSFDYRRSARAEVGDVLRMQSSVTHVGRTSLTVEHRLLTGEGAEISSLTQMAFTWTKTGDDPRRFPKRFSIRPGGCFLARNPAAGRPARPEIRQRSRAACRRAAPGRAHPRFRD